MRCLILPRIFKLTEHYHKLNGSTIPFWSAYSEVETVYPDKQLTGEENTGNLKWDSESVQVFPGEEVEEAHVHGHGH